MSAEGTNEEHRYAEFNRNYNLYLNLINQYLPSEEGILDVSKAEDNMVDDDITQLTIIWREDDVRSICFVRSKVSSVQVSCSCS